MRQKILNTIQWFGALSRLRKSKKIKKIIIIEVSVEALSVLFRTR